jgi:predicted amidohydrolase
MRIKLAVAQLEAKQYQSKKMFKKIENFVSIASEKKAGVIIFPEDCIEGIISMKKHLADSKNENMDRFIKLAKKYKIDIVTGSFIEKEEDKLENVSYYIDSLGEVKARYVKINLWHPEKRYLSPGKNLKIFNTKYGKAAIVICWDLAFSDLFREMLKKGVKIIYCPSYWTFEDASMGLKWNKNADKLLVDSLCSTRAFEANAAIVYCNASGKLSLGKFQGHLLGHSQICLPYLGAVKKLKHQKEEMFIEELDLDILKDSEKSYKLRNDVS